MMYTSEPRLITRLGAAGSHVPRERGKRLGETDEVGGHLGGGGGFERPDRFLRPKAEEYPVELGRFSTMKEILQDAYVTSATTPGPLNHISGYTGFQPRCPPAAYGSAEWAEISHAGFAPPAPPQ